MANIDLETLKLMKEIFQPVPSPVQVQASPQPNFISTLRENWVFVALLISIGVWIVNGTNEQKQVNTTQDSQIQTTIKDIAQNTADIEQLNHNVQSVSSAQISNYNELIRKMDAFQTALEALKTQQ